MSELSELRDRVAELEDDVLTISRGVGNRDTQLRDKFAGLALAWAMENCVEYRSNGLTWKQAAAREAYQMADAMIEEMKARR